MSSKTISRPDPASLGLPPGGADSHAHLDLFAKRAGLTDILNRAEACGVSHIGQVFLGPEAYEARRAAYRDRPNVCCILGIHPNDAMQCTGQALAAMRRAFEEDGRLRALGEIGLDFYWRECPPLEQEAAFRLQLELARERDLPVVIHSRNAAPQTLAVLEAEGFAGRPLLWHCFGGEDAVPLLERFLANGWHISIPGPVTYPANHDLRAAVARIPPDRLLLETDCPYLAPLPWRGKTNEPAFAVFTAQTAAACLEMDPPDLWRLCGANARRFFGLEAARGA
jgi:TatD DNase family protein